MEEEILLDMYRKSWNDFLEAYKEKMDQVSEYEKLLDNLIELCDKDKEKKFIKSEKERINGRS